MEPHPRATHPGRRGERVDVESAGIWYALPRVPKSYYRGWASLRHSRETLSEPYATHYWRAASDDMQVSVLPVQNKTLRHWGIHSTVSTAHGVVVESTRRLDFGVRSYLWSAGAGPEHTPTPWTRDNDVNTQQIHTRSDARVAADGTEDEWEQLAAPERGRDEQDRWASKVAVGSRVATSGKDLQVSTCVGISARVWRNAPSIVASTLAIPRSRWELRPFSLTRDALQPASQTTWHWAVPRPCVMSPGRSGERSIPVEIVSSAPDVSLAQKPRAPT
ncbi:hypothetical protein VTO73DRAFT_37 [Trametes versicolor]